MTFKSNAPPWLDGPPLLDYGLLCERSPAWAGRTDDPIVPVARVNLVQQLWPYGDCGLDWNGRIEPRWTLALCVLDRMFPPGKDEVSFILGKPLHVSHKAIFLHRLFAADLLPRIPFWGGELRIAQLWEYATLKIGDPIDLSTTPN